MPSENSIELRSPGAQEIFGRTPHWLLPWSNTILFVFVMVLFLLSYFIKYPDVITAKVTITTRTPPIAFTPKINGGIRLLRPNGAKVAENEFVAYMETGADIERIRFLHRNIILWHRLCTSGQFENLVRTNFPENIQIAQLDTYYSKFLLDLERYRIFLLGSEDRLTKSALTERIAYFEKLNIHLKRQQSISEADLALSNKKTVIDSILLAQRVIPTLEFNSSKSRHNQIMFNLESSQSNYISNLIQIRQLREQLDQIEVKRADSKRIYEIEMMNDVSLLKQELVLFAQQYLFISPVSGTLSYPFPLVDNQYVMVGQSVFNVVPNKGRVTGNLSLEMRGAGKVQKGQTVNIKLDNYPYQEFGFLKGKIVNIEITPNGNTYSATVELTKGLKTTYNRSLPFTYNMLGTAEIITNDLRLIERFFNQFRNINS